MDLTKEQIETAVAAVTKVTNPDTAYTVFRKLRKLSETPTFVKNKDFAAFMVALARNAREKKEAATEAASAKLIGFWLTGAKIEECTDPDWIDKKKSFFLKRLARVEESLADKNNIKGVHVCPACDKKTGGITFAAGDFTWTPTVRHAIIKHGFRPSSEFRQWIRVMVTAADQEAEKE